MSNDKISYRTEKTSKIAIERKRQPVVFFSFFFCICMCDTYTCKTYQLTLELFLTWNGMEYECFRNVFAIKQNSIRREFSWRCMRNECIAFSFSFSPLCLLTSTCEIELTHLTILAPMRLYVCQKHYNKQTKMAVVVWGEKTTCIGQHNATEHQLKFSGCANFERIVFFCHWWMRSLLWFGLVLVDLQKL